MQKKSTIYRTIKWLDGFAPNTLLFFVFCLDVLIAWVDYITGPLAPITPFFLLPIILSAFFLNRFWAYFFALVSAIAVIPVVSQLLSSFSLMPIMLGFLSRLIVYLAFAFLGLKFRHLLNELEKLASQDTLTTASSGRFFYEFGTTELARSLRSKSPLCLVFIDLDNFKEVNDQHGHQKGDQLLIQIAMTIKSNLREGDILGRLGGDEFAILLTQTSQEDAKIIINRMQANLLQAIMPFQTSVTFSIGVVTYLADKQTSVEDLVSLADQAMYDVKKSTKNAIQYVIA